MQNQDRSLIRVDVQCSSKCGLRQANVLGREWPDVDLERRTAWVHADQPKGGEAIGVPLNEYAMSVLNEENRTHPKRVF